MATVLGAALVAATVAVPARAAGVGTKPLDGAFSLTQGVGPAGFKHNNVEPDCAASPILQARFRWNNVEPDCAASPILQARFRWNNVEPDCAASPILQARFRWN